MCVCDIDKSYKTGSTEPTIYSCNRLNKPGGVMVSNIFFGSCDVASRDVEESVKGMT